MQRISNYIECSTCEKRCGKQSSVKCCNCSKYQHVKCTKLTKQQMSLHPNLNKNYLCFACMKTIFPFQQVCDAEFKEMFQHHCNIGTDKYIINTLNDEPDIDEITNTDCKYRSIEWYKQSILNSKKQQDLSILHLNVRSIVKNKHVIEELLIELGSCPEILAITETKLNDDKLNYTSISNYSFVCCNSSTNAGGVAFYILNSLKFNRREDLEFNSDDSENLFIEVNITKNKVFIIGVIYRHPTCSLKKFQEQLLLTLNKLAHDKLDFVICGDYNVDLLKHEIKQTVNDYIDAVHTEGCFNIINKPTRITDTSATLLDHVYTNVSQHISSRGILTFEISDHLPTFCSLTSKPILKQEKVLMRDMNKFDKTKFLDDVYSLTQELNDAYKDDFNPNNAINQLLDKFSNLINQHVPLRPQTRKEIKLNTKPWLSEGILKSIRNKNTMFKKCYKHNDAALTEKYKQFANKLTTIKRVARHNY